MVNWRNTLPDKRRYKRYFYESKITTSDYRLSYKKYITGLDTKAFFVPMTLLDESLELEGINLDRYLRCGGNTARADITLSHGNLWAIVIDHLTKISVKILEDRRLTDTNQSIVYSKKYFVPIVGKKLLCTVRKITKTARFFSDEASQPLYVRVSSETRRDEFLPYGKVKYAYLNVPRIYGSLSLSRDYGGVVSHIRPEEHMRHSDGRIESKCKDNGQYAEIDLGKNTVVTHVSTMGKRHDIHRHGAELHYVEETAKNWVSTYVLYARRDSQHVYTRLGKYSGNTDRLTEVVHELDQPMNVRYLLFVPLSHSNYRTMQIGIFGPSEKPDTGSENIEYTLIMPCKKSHNHRLRKEKLRTNPKWINPQYIIHESLRQHTKLYNNYKQLDE